MAPGDRANAIHIAGLTGEWDRHDGFDFAMSSARQSGLYRIRIDVEGVRLDIDEDRPRAQISHHFGGRGKGERRRDYFIARSDSQCEQRQMERSCAMRHRKRVARSDISREVSLKPF